MSAEPADGDGMIAALGALAPGRVRHGLLPRGGRRLRWFEVGDGPAIVVLEPGAGVPTTTWFPVLPDLTRQARVIMYDRAGYGGSDRAPRLSLQGSLGDLEAVVAAVGGGGPCVLVGHSWGGLLVQMLALARPDLVSGLVLVDPANEQSWLALPSQDLEQAARSDQDLDLEECVAEQAAMAEEISLSTSDDPEVRSLLIRADTAYAATEQQIRDSAAELPLLVASLGELVERRGAAQPAAVPSVLLTAVKERPEPYRGLAIDGQTRLAATMPRARHQIIEDAGHYIHIDQPHYVIDAVREVLRQTDSLPPAE